QSGCEHQQYRQRRADYVCHYNSQNPMDYSKGGSNLRKIKYLHRNRLWYRQSARAYPRLIASSERLSGRSLPRWPMRMLCTIMVMGCWASSLEGAMPPRPDMAATKTMSQS